MAFDPSKPIDDSLATAAELRGQFNALKAICDAQQAQITALQQQAVTSLLVLTANNATMSLDWTYYGPPCDGFHIFVHEPNEPAGTFNDRVQVAGDLRSWKTDFDTPADALGYAYYIVPMDGDEHPLTPPGNTVSFGTPSPGDLQSQLNAQEAQIADLQLASGDNAAAITALQAAVAELQQRCP